MKQVHLLQTSRDAAVPWEPVQYMLDNFPNACVEILPVTGHLPHLTHPKIVAEALSRHLKMPIRTVVPKSDLEDQSLPGSTSQDSGMGSARRVNGNGEFISIEKLLE